MIKRKHISEPFENVSTQKHAYDMSNVQPERLRKEIKDYMENLYPFMAAGLQYVNFKKSPDADGNAVGSIDYDSNGVNITIPIILEENNLKEPTVGIYNNRIIPLDKEYLEYIVDYPEYGEQISENELPANMQYILQKGLFQGDSPTVSKHAEVPIGTIFEEDQYNPYHYHATILKQAVDNTVRVIDGVYCNSSEMLKLTKQAEEAKKTIIQEVKVIGKDERIGKAPIVSKITDSGLYRNVFIGGDVKSANVVCSLFSIVPGVAAKSLALTVVDSREPYEDVCCEEDVAASQQPSWAYGDVMGSGYSEPLNSWRILNSSLVKTSSPQGKYILFVDRKEAHYALGSDGIKYSIPYHVKRQENLNYGDAGTKATVLWVEDPQGGSYCFIASDKTADIRKVDREKLKGSGLGHIYEENMDYYLIPESLSIMEIKGNKASLTTAADGYGSIVEKVSADYPNTMTIINKGANLYSVNVSNADSLIKHADVSANGALLLANYYTGSDKSNIAQYSYEQPYQVNGDISKKAFDRAGMNLLSKYRGEFKKLAEHIKSYKAIEKIADIGATVDKLVGVEASIDDEWMGTNDVLHLLDNVISKIAELLLMARLGKNDISESILGRAMYAIVKLSNEVRGVSNTGSY